MTAQAPQPPVASPAPSPPHGPKPLSKRVGHSMLLVRLIAVDKFVKAAVLLIVGIYLLHMIRLDQNLHDTLRDFVNDLRIDENNHFIHGLLEKTLGVTPRTLYYFYTGTLIYSGLYLIEGLGLYFDRAWAEWLTVITTAGFLPLEILEIYREVTWFRIVVFVGNILMVVYLLLRLHWRHAATKAGIDVKLDPEARAEVLGKAPDAGGNVPDDSHG